MKIEFEENGNHYTLESPTFPITIDTGEFTLVLTTYDATHAVYVSPYGRTVVDIEESK